METIRFEDIAYQKRKLVNDMYIELMGMGVGSNFAKEIINGILDDCDD